MPDDNDKKTPSDALRDFQKALDEGRVETPLDFCGEVLDDGESKLSIGKIPDMNLAVLTISNEGGFFSVYVNGEQWEIVKKRMDEVVRSLQGRVQ